jgi:branched-chain amino acid transport system ATP-binding protein
MTQTKSLAANQVSVRFSGLSALSGINLNINPNEIVGLIGPNGAGKTTLVNCFTGFQKPTAGQVFLGKENLTGWSAERIRRAGISRTFQSGRLFKDLPVLDNVVAASLGLGMSRSAAFKGSVEILAWVGLTKEADQVASALAYTDQRRLGIARALVSSPQFILLDEPAAGMSDAEGEELVALISRIRQTFRCGLLLIEHNMRIVMNACDRVHVLDGGYTIAEGVPSAIRANKTVIGAYLGVES